MVRTKSTASAGSRRHYARCMDLSVVLGVIAILATVWVAWWGIGRATRTRDEDLIARCLDRLEVANRSLIGEVRRLLDAVGNVASPDQFKLDTDIWRSHRTECKNAVLAASRSFPRFGRRVREFALGVDNQLRVVRWDDPHDYEFERVLAWLIGLQSAMDDWRTNPRRANGRRALSALDLARTEVIGFTAPAGFRPRLQRVKTGRLVPLQFDPDLARRSRKPGPE